MVLKENTALIEDTIRSAANREIKNKAQSTKHKALGGALEQSAAQLVGMQLEPHGLVESPPLSRMGFVLVVLSDDFEHSAKEAHLRRAVIIKVDEPIVCVHTTHQQRPFGLVNQINGEILGLVLLNHVVWHERCVVNAPKRLVKLIQSLAVITVHK